MKREMQQLVKEVATVLELNRNEPDPHWTTCRDIADAFDLWEEDVEGLEGTQRFPLWLTFIVAGVARDMGLLE